MKKIIKNKEKMKNTMYIVFGVFALALFTITRANPSYASDGLIFDNALDAIVQGTTSYESLTEDNDPETIQENEEQPEMVIGERNEGGEENNQNLDETTSDKENIKPGEDINETNNDQEEINENNEEQEYENINNNMINENEEENNKEINEEAKNNEDEENKWEGMYGDFKIDKEENTREIMGTVKTATLLPGEDFNKKIKTLAKGTSVTNNYEENASITSIQKGTATDSVKTDYNRISIASSEYPVYAWFDGGEGVLYYDTEATKIYFNENCKHMFNNLKGLEDFNFKQFDLSRVTIMESMFYAAGLKKIDFSNMDLRNVTNIDYMLQSNQIIEEADFSNVIMSGVENTNRGLFYGIDSLKKVNLSGADFRNLKNLKYMFGYCHNLEEVNLHNVNFGEATTLWFMFVSNNQLRKADFSNANFGNVTDVSGLFSSCDNLSEVNYSYTNFRMAKPTWTDQFIPYNVEKINFEGTNLGSVESMKYWFQSKDKLKEINFSGTILDSLEDMSYMFQSNKSLTGIDFTHTDLSHVITMEQMFGSAEGIQSVNFSGCDLSSLKNTKQMFNAANNLRNVNFYGTILTGLKDTEEMFIKSYNSTPYNYIDFREAKFGPSMYGMFKYTKALNIDLSGADFTNVTDMSKTFYNITTPININFNNIKGANNITGTKEMFYSMKTLTGIDLSNFDFGKVEDMSYMFQYCENIINIKFGENEINNVKNMSNMFQNCYYLSGLDLSKFKTNNVTDMSYMFNECHSLKTLDLTNFDTSNVTNMDHMFYQATALTGLDLSSFKTNNVTNMSYMFNGDGGLGVVYVTDGYFNTDNVVDSQNMFSAGMLLKWRSIYDKTYARIPTEEYDGVFTDILDKPYTIKYNTNEGILTGEKTIYTQRDSFTLQIPIRTGYTFLGWTGSNGDEPETTVNIAKYTKGDLEYTANWKINQYKIIFDTDGGNEINSIEREYSGSLLDITLPTPVKECNDFSGWNTELPELMPAHDITLKAIWNYTCSRASGGGGGKKSEPSTSEVTNDTTNEHNSADENTTKPSDTTTAPINEETTKEVISVTQEVADDGTEVEVVVEAVAIKNTNIVATVRTETPVNGVSSYTSSSSSSTTHTKEQTDAYSFAKANGITTTESIETAKMNTELTRIQMAKMLSNFAINVLGEQPDVSKGTADFDDVTNKMDEQYDNAVTKAYQLGIMGQNVKDNEFRPNDEVSRAEFTASLSRLLYKTDEGEYKGTNKYYVPHIAKLYNEGIVNKADPKIKEKRGYVMTMLKRTVE